MQIAVATTAHVKEPPSYGLLVRAGQDKGKLFHITKDRFLIGRGEKCDVRLQSQRVNQTHCIFVPTRSGIVFSNLGNRNRAKVNGEPVRSNVKLTPGDLIDVCTFVVELVLVEAGESAKHQQRDQ